MHPWNSAVLSALEPLANPENAKQMQSYMRDQFLFYGIQSTQRRTALKPLWHKARLPETPQIPQVVRELWLQPQRELQMVAVDLLIKYKNQLPASFLADLEWLITTKSWWDTVDMLASHVTAALYHHHSAETQDYLNRWRQSDNIWLRRSAILYQLKFKQQTDEKWLFGILKDNQADNEFFIQKAIGWALREYSKTNPDAVTSFINQQDIQGLAKREGLKWLNKQR